MRHILIVLFTIALTSCQKDAPIAASEPTHPLSPHPGILWKTTEPFAEYQVEISRDAAFGKILDADTIANVGRYVPSVALEPGRYYWRVFTAGSLYQEGSFEVGKPARTIDIPVGSDMEVIRSALEQARHLPATTIRFEPGTYELHPGEDGTLFHIEETENLIIDGQGAEFVMYDIARVADIRFSRHITLRNFRIDYETPIYTAAKVESIAADGTMILSLLPGCAPPETVPRFMEEQRGLFYQPEYPRMAENIPLLVYMNAPWEPLGDGKYRLKAAHPPNVRHVKEGMVYICAPRYRAQGVEIQHAKDVTLVDITTYYLPGIGVSTVLCEDLKLIRLNMLRRSDRLLGVQNGGTNLHNARVGPWVEDCRFENTGDDNNHINALVMTAVARPDSRTLHIAPNFPGVILHSPDLGIRSQDELAFFDRLAGRKIAVARVAAVDRLPDGNTRVVLDRDIPEIVLGTGANFPQRSETQIYNLDQAAGNFVFRDNVFLRGRRIGILAKSGPGLIERNQFIELGGGGVEIFNAPFEGLHGHDILIRDNHFERGGLVFRNRGPFPAIWTIVFESREADALHRSIRIIDNVIIDYLGVAMDINDAVGVRIQGNHFRNRKLQHLRQPDGHLIHFENVEDVLMENNIFQDQRFAEERWVFNGGKRSSAN